MSVINFNSCRICLSASYEFISIFGKFHGRSVKRIVENVTRIKIKRDPKIPKFICENCFNSLLNAESIISVCRKNNDFLNELASVEDEEIIMEVVDHEEIPQFNNYTVIDSSSYDIPWETFEKLNQESKNNQKVQIQNYFCSFCGKIFNNRKKLIYHEKSRHSKMTQPIKPFTCDRCGMSFKQKSHIINHLNVVHLRIKRYHCNICGFSMYSKSHYTAHVKTHSKIKEFACERCEKSFARKETLLIHQRTHDGLRNYVCKFCGKSYTSHTDLKRHLYKHTKIHPYVCELCKAGFFLKRELFEHCEKNHQGIDTSSWLNGKKSWLNLMN